MSAGSSDDEALLGEQDRDPLYGEDLDERDEAYVRAKYRPAPPAAAARGGTEASAEGAASSVKEVPTDGQLSCPACFTPVCLDCQRHQNYMQQFRAIFVMNVRIRDDYDLVEQANGKFSRSAPVGGNASATYKAVACSHCGTDVGVIDQEEIYHFFNVLHSN
jgi:hypothetical protein